MIYETPEDLARERALALWLAEEMGWDDPIKLPQLSRVDWLVPVEGKEHLCLETKWRFNPLLGYPASGAYEDYIIDVDKLEEGLSYAALRGLPFWLAVRFTDGVYWLLVTKLWRWKKEMHPGRKGRNAPRVVYHIPPADFRYVGEGPTQLGQESAAQAPVVLAELGATEKLEERRPE